MTFDDYENVPRTTTVPTLEEMVTSAQKHPDVWARQIEQRAKNIEHARSHEGFDQIVLAQMVEHQLRAKAALRIALEEPHA